MNESSAPHVHPTTTENQDQGHPHACYEGVIYVRRLVEDPGTGEEAEILEVVPCRRCADGR